MGHSGSPLVKVFVGPVLMSSDKAKFQRDLTIHTEVIDFTFSLTASNSAPDGMLQFLSASLHVCIIEARQ